MWRVSFRYDTFTGQVAAIIGSSGELGKAIALDLAAVCNESRLFRQTRSYA
jgi:hypothetical protein